MMATARELFNEAFSVSRDPRSDAYKAGVIAVLRLHVEGVRVRQPYRLGTAEADAFSSGCGEGHLIFRKSKELRHE
jgi:hypothetical protein